VIDQDMSYQSTDEVHWTARKQTLARAIYVATIAAAMLGWLWFIAWIALYLLF
jgi:preprotein translocase subunit SecE